MKLSDIPQTDAAGIDQFAWQAIKNWPAAAGFNPVHDGLDFGELTRWALWSRVGRAIRAKLDPKEFNFEKNLLFQFDHHRPPKQRSAISRLLQDLKRSSSLSGQKEKPASSTQIQEAVAKGPMGAKGRANPALFVPHPSPRLEGMVAALIARGYPVTVSAATALAGYAGASCCRNPGPAGYDRAFADRLYAAILAGLKKQGLRLLPFDKDTLFSLLNVQLERLGKAAAEIDLVAPKALLIHGDNHPPYQEYVAVANRKGLPTIAFQHGLDCERYYLDDAFCSAMAVWSEQRKQRYENDSGKPPALLQVTGNPAFDSVSTLPERIETQGDFVLWITRPHTSSYCYSPSRRVTEGLDILDALLKALAETPGMQLVIKPHPQDYAFLYEGRIAEKKLSERAQVATGDLNTFISKAKIVISEDSTGGMEAMLQGKILIHSHFAASAPVLPFCEYHAALPGYSREMLLASLARAERMSDSELEEMLAGQRAFIGEFAGELDGEATERQISFVSSILDKENLS